MTEEKLVPVFIPALVAILVNAEDKKGEPLSKEEVIAIRDDAAEIFELPGEFVAYKVGDLLEIRDDEVFDWMINDNSTLYGGYTLRVQRESMTAEERQRFDEHIGVVNYA
ncbi:MAG: DUF2314 domain-containing protein [Rhodocyclaceae bacterium]